ncbi:TPA: hypothetical protein P0E23_005120 [Vibrio harveyi]|nr:hypothetical protein [Vibrio harveyi]
MNICFSISEVNWELTKDVVSIIGTLGGLGIGSYGLWTWKRAHKFEKKSEYITELDIAIHGWRESAYPFRNATWAFQRNEITIQEFTVRITEHAESKSAYKKYLRLLKHELGQNAPDLIKMDKRFINAFERFLQFKVSTEDICMTQEERAIVSQGAEFRAVCDEFIELIYSLKK